MAPLQDWEGTWSLAEGAALPDAFPAPWLSTSFRLRVQATTFTVEEVSAEAKAAAAAFCADLDGVSRPCPLPLGDGSYAGKWPEESCFSVDISKSSGDCRRLSWRLTAPEELQAAAVALSADGSPTGEPVIASFRKACSAGPAPVAWLRARGATIDTAEERVRVLQCLSELISGEGLEEIGAAQLADRVVPPRFDGTAKALQIAVKHYQELIPKWMEPEAIEDTCPPFLRHGVEAEWFVMNEPKGVGIVVVPWNAPVTLACIPALGMLAAGNRLVIKTAELTPTVAAVVRRLFHKHLYGYVWVEEGGREAVERLIDEGADHLVFTGGGEIAKVVAARCAQHLTPVTLELGGKSPVFVDKGLSDEMLETVVAEILETKVYKTGQFCCAHDYALVHEDLHALFCKKFEAAVVALGEKRNIKLIGPRQYAAVKKKLEDAAVECIPAMSGPYVPDDANMTLPMTGLLSPSPDSAVLTTEIFGPVLPIVKVSGVDEAVHLVRGNPVGKPLIAYCCTGDQASVDAFLKGVSAGNVAVNGGPQRFHLNLNVGFGGIGPSGTGTSMWGKEALREFSHRKHVLHAKEGFARSYWSGHPAPK